MDITITAPPRPIPATPPADCPECPPGGNCAEKEIRVSALFGSQCCIYVAWMSCAAPGAMAYWFIEYTVADDLDPPIFNFFPQMQDGSGADGFIPTYAYAATLPGTDLTGFAESCFLEVLDIAGGFTGLHICCIPVADDGSVNEESLICYDMTDFFDCTNGVRAGTNNGGSEPPGSAFKMPDSSPSTDEIFTTFFHGKTGCNFVYDAGFIADGTITSARITSGVVQYPILDPEDPNTCDAGCCFNNREGCTPSIPEENINDSNELIVGEVEMTQDAATGCWYVSKTAIGFDGGGDEFLWGVGKFQVETNLGTCEWIVANSACF